MFANYFGAVCNKVKFIQRSLRKISMRNFENTLTDKTFLNSNLYTATNVVLNIAKFRISAIVLKSDFMVELFLLQLPLHNSEKFVKPSH